MKIFQEQSSFPILLLLERCFAEVWSESNVLRSVGGDEGCTLTTTDPPSAIIWSASAFYCRPSTCAHISVTLLDILFSYYQTSPDLHLNPPISPSQLLFIFIFITSTSLESTAFFRNCDLFSCSGRLDNSPESAACDRDDGAPAKQDPRPPEEGGAHPPEADPTVNL